MTIDGRTEAAHQKLQHPRTIAVYFLNHLVVLLAETDSQATCPAIPRSWRGNAQGRKVEQVLRLSFAPLLLLPGHHLDHPCQPGYITRYESVTQFLSQLALQGPRHSATVQGVVRQLLQSDSLSINTDGFPTCPQRGKVLGIS